LFAQENKDHRQNEIIFAITPHIIRAEEITDENRQLIEVGTGNTIGLRYKKELKPAKADTPNSPDSPSAQKRVKPVPAARVTEPTESSAPGAAIAPGPVPAAQVVAEPTKTSAPEGATIAPGPPVIRPRPSGMTSSVPTILRPSTPKHSSTGDQGPSSQ
jgi:hypothetical protein